MLFYCCYIVVGNVVVRLVRSKHNSDFFCSPIWLLTSDCLNFWLMIGCYATRAKRWQMRRAAAVFPATNAVGRNSVREASNLTAVATALAIKRRICCCCTLLHDRGYSKLEANNQMSVSAVEVIFASLQQHFVLFYFIFSYTSTANVCLSIYFDMFNFSAVLSRRAHGRSFVCNRAAKSRLPSLQRLSYNRMVDCLLLRSHIPSLLQPICLCARTYICICI